MTIKNAERISYIKNNEAFVIINQEIDEIIASQIQDFFIGLEFFTNESVDSPNYIKNVNIIINSVGGSVIDGYTIINCIQNCSFPTTSKVMGVAYSMAAVIALSTNKIEFYDYSILMIHKAWNSSNVESEGLNRINESLLNILEKKFGNKTKQLLETDSFFNAKDLLKNGIIDLIYTIENENIKNENANKIFAKYIEDKFMNTEIQTELLETELETIVENEVEETATLETEVEETVETTETEIELLKKEIEILNEKLNLEISKSEKLADEINAKLIEKENEEKKEILVKAGVDKSEFSSFMAYSKTDLEFFTSKLKITKQAPVFNLVRDNSGLDIKKMSANEVAILRNSDPELYKELMLKAK